MALSVGELVAYITADNRGFERGLGRAQDDLEDFTRDANGRLRDARGRFVSEGEAAGDGFGNGLVGMAAKAIKAGFSAGGAVLAPLAGLPLAVAAIGATAAAAAPLIAQAAAATAEFASSAAGAAPALLALGVAYKIASASLKALFAEGTAAREALSPLAKALEEATKAGSEAAARGIRPLAEELKRVVQPTVTAYMVEVGEAANIVQKRFLGWAKSADGLRTLKGILDPISQAMKDLAPEVSDLAIAFSRMLGRIMGVSVAAGKNGAAGAIEWLTEKLNEIDASDVSEGLKTISDAFSAVKSVVGTLSDWIGTLVDAFKTYNTEFKAVADGASILGLAFGGPIVKAVSAIGLIVRHFDKLKAAWQTVKDAFQGEGNEPLTQFFDSLKNAAAEVWPSIKSAFEQIKESVLPVLEEIWRKISEDLVPAFGDFIEAAAPLVSWLIDTLAPVVSETFGVILRIISGTIDIIIGIFKVFTGILTGDWSKLWEGIKQILDGAAQIIVAGLRQMWALIKFTFVATLRILKAIFWDAIEAIINSAEKLGGGVADAFSSAWGAVKGALGWLKDRIVGFFSGAASWLWNAGKNILSGLINGVESMIGTLRSKLNWVTNLIPDWKGPESRDRVLLEPAGTAIMSGLVSGIEASLPALRSTLAGVTAGIQGAVPGRIDVAAMGAMPVRADAEMGRRGLPVARVLVDVTGGSDEMKELVRGWVITDGGGDVQVALGQA